MPSILFPYMQPFAISPKFAIAMAAVSAAVGAASIVALGIA